MCLYENEIKTGQLIEVDGQSGVMAGVTQGTVGTERGASEYALTSDCDIEAHDRERQRLAGQR